MIEYELVKEHEDKFDITSNLDLLHQLMTMDEWNNMSVEEQSDIMARVGKEVFEGTDDQVDVSGERSPRTDTDMEDMGGVDEGEFPPDLPLEDDYVKTPRPKPESHRGDAKVPWGAGDFGRDKHRDKLAESIRSRMGAKEKAPKKAPKKAPSDEFKYNYPPGTTGRQFEPAEAGTGNPQRPAHRMTRDHPDYPSSMFGRVGPPTNPFMAGGPPSGDITEKDKHVRQSAARQGMSPEQSTRMGKSLDDEKHQDDELSAELFQRLMRENVNPEDLTPEERMEYYRELAELNAEDPSQPYMPDADIPEANRVPPPFNEPRKPKLDDDPPVTKMLFKAFGLRG